jgi:hypothetical protein
LNGFIILAPNPHAVSHGRLRKETNCLNCDAQVDGRYCKNCGQENLEPKQTFWHLVTHFFNDVTHFDGKFFTTLKSLLLKPGFLTEEYVKGRRMKYLDPVRMYLFVSFAFFLMYLAVGNDADKLRYSHDPELVHAIDSIIAIDKGSNDFNMKGAEINGKNVMLFNFGDNYSQGLKHYDSLQNTLPDSLKSDELSQYLEKSIIGVANTYYQNPYDFMGNLMDKFYHSFSKVFFISLPIFSLVLTLLYIRRRKEFFYVSHAIFTLHCYIVAWFFLLIIAIIKALIPDSDVLSAIMTLLLYFGLSVYILVAMLRFYKQSGLKTGIKWLILIVIMSVLLLLILLGLLINSFFAMASGH